MELIELSDDMIQEVFENRMPDDFPAAEIKTPDMVKALIDEGHYRGYGYFENGELVAYAILITAGRGLLLDYLAISGKMRGRGIGSMIMKELAGYYGNGETMILEVEDPDAAADENDRSIRNRRIDFYLKNGARMTGVKSRIINIDFRIMTFLNTDLTDDTVREVYRDIYSCLGEIRKRINPAAYELETGMSQYE